MCVAPAAGNPCGWLNDDGRLSCLRVVQSELSDTFNQTRSPSYLPTVARFRMNVWDEVLALVTLSWPIWLSGVAEAVNGAVAALFLGRDPNPALLGGAYVAMSVFSVLAMCPLMGLSSGVTTLVATAIGARELDKIGAYVQLGTAINTTYALACMVPMVVFPAPLLRILLGDKQPQVLGVAAAYLRIYSLRLFPYAVLRPVHRALMAQSVTWPMPVGALFIVVSNAALHAVLVRAAGLGAVGSAIASTVAPMLQTVCLLALVTHLGLNPTVWGRWDPPAAAAAARPYLRLALPGAALMCAEWWALEATTLLMSRREPAVLAAHVVAVNISVILYMTPAALGLGVMTRVGNALGAATPEAARRACWVAVSTGTAVGCFLAAALFVTRHLWPGMYSANGTVQALLVGVAPWLAAIVLVDATLAVLGRVLRGSGRQRLGAAICLLGYWGGTLPLCWALAATGGAAGGGAGALRGVWVGLAVGKAAVTGVMLAVAVGTNWEDQAARALQRLGRPAAVSPLVGDGRGRIPPYGSGQDCEEGA